MQRAMRMRFPAAVLGLLAATVCSAQVPAGDPLLGQPGVVRAGFIYEKAPFPQCHASTIAEGKTGLVAAWFGGTRERHPDVGIWTARHDGTAWSAPVEVANGVQADGKRHPCWNPVLYQAA